MKISRRHFLQQSLAATTILAAHSPAATAGPAEQWCDVSGWHVEGRGWEDQPRQRFFDRLPARAEGVVRSAVWNLSRHSAGMMVRFRTDATALLVDYTLLSPTLAMPHMPATGVSGLDLYCQVEDGSFRWLNVTRPAAQHVQGPLVEGLTRSPRTYQLYLPLYNGIESLRLGVEAGAQLEPLGPRPEKKPLLFYGTSIMHGACASRPGMAIPALLGRRLDRPTINLGFSGNGRMDPELAPLLAELDPAVYCLDCLPNMNPDLVRERAVPFVQRLRQARPETPILLVEDRVFTNARFFPSKQQFHQDNHRALRAAYQSLRDDGDPALYYLEGDLLLGPDGEGATDGSHPNDLGFVRYAEAYAQALQPLLS
jgi:lysophospholipase L1-like esterase